MEITPSARKHPCTSGPMTSSALDALTPATHPARDASHFRAIIAARKEVEQADEHLVRAVSEARQAGDSWSVIGAALDTTRQAAFQRFARRIP